MSSNIMFAPLENNTLLILLILWTIPWKGVALWKAARKGEKWWYIILLVVNSAALLEAAYIFYFSEQKKKRKKEAPGS